MKVMRESPWKHLPRDVRRFLRRHPEYDELSIPRDSKTGESVGYDRVTPEEAGRSGPTRARRRVGSVEDLPSGEEPLDVEDVLARLGAGPPWDDPGKPPPRQQLQLRVWRARLDFLIGKLPRHYQVLVLEHYVHGRTVSDIARDQGVAAHGSVQRTLERAVQELRRLLVKHAHELANVGVEEL